MAELATSPSRRHRGGTGAPFRLLWAAVIALTVIVVGPADGATPAHAQALDGVAVDGEPCETADGVTVIVDFQELGDDTLLVGCAPDAPADGFDALDQAGIPHRTTVVYPDFLCRIADRPADDPCDTTSPANAYWSYWLAPAGGDWCYSNKGAGNRTPPLGAVEGWSFALDRTSEDVPPPRFAPPPPPEGVAALPLAEDDCVSGAVPVDEASTDAAVGQGDPVDLDAEDGGAGTPVATIVGIAVIALVVAAGVVVARRRRSTTPTTGSKTATAAPRRSPAASAGGTGAGTGRSTGPAHAGDPVDDGWTSVLASRDEPGDPMWARPAQDVGADDAGTDDDPPPR